ncbi:MAG: hypothetical protein COV69_03265 [Parcubacteria group bacterium CG11_big_fil_rev_8_21_14_0_20_39_14]|nr:MAG: hypothetical protein COV69_03265 [Parcubacteria group bacterium CG11_big_fil_rev_8_21_14_0_20_39_14]PIS35512.1 MAG: hypothetical protein COT36_01980 [Parcubacteria group bacterium CG08_land_8_20_14_0_20_38_56]
MFSCVYFFASPCKNLISHRITQEPQRKITGHNIYALEIDLAQITILSIWRIRLAIKSITDFTFGGKFRKQKTS